MGDNAGDSVGPSADGFETYGVTGVALITFIMLAVREPLVQVQLLVWIFMMRIIMVVASGLSYFINEAMAKARYGNAPKMNFEHPLTSLVMITSGVSVVLTYITSYLLIPTIGGDREPVVEACQHHHLRHARRRDHPRARQGLHLGGLEPRARSGEPVRKRAAPRSTSSRAWSPATSRPTGSGSPSCS